MNRSTKLRQRAAWMGGRAGGGVRRENLYCCVCVFADSKLAAHNTAFSARGVEENSYETETK